MQPGQHLLSHYRCLVTSFYDRFSCFIPVYNDYFFHRPFYTFEKQLEHILQGSLCFSGVQLLPDVHNLYSGLCHPHRHTRGDSGHLASWNSEESANDNTQEAKRNNCTVH